MSLLGWLASGNILHGAIYLLVVEVVLFGLGYAVWDSMDRKKSWFIQDNSNTGKITIFRAVPGSEGLKRKVGKDELFVKLKAGYMRGRSDRGNVFDYDADTGQVHRPVPGKEGLWEGLDGKTWAAFLKSGVNMLIGQSAGGGLMQTLLMAAVVLGGITLIVVGFIAYKFSSGVG